jgi:hypothetical protein
MIIVTGDSFTTPNLPSELFPDFDTNYNTWSDYIPGPVKNVATSGLDNVTMIDRVIKEILITDDVTKVVVALGNWYRFTLPHCSVDPEWIHYSDTDDSDPDYMDWVAKSTDLKSVYEFNMHYCSTYNWSIERSAVRTFSINQTLYSMYVLYDICKSKGIELHIFQMIKPIRNYDSRLYELFVDEVENNVWFKKLDAIKDDNLKLIGWPYFMDMGGVFAQKILDRSCKIGWNDGHPNQKGHRMLGAWYNEKSITE